MADRSPREIRRVVWLSTTFNQVGGGERLLLEGVRFLEGRGIETTVATFAFHERAFFDGRYQARVVRLLADEPGRRRSPIGRASYWLTGLVALRRLISVLDPDLLIAQSESSAILLDAVTRRVGRPYLLFIFGQMYQFPEDLTKYARAFRRHLPAIRESQPGYRETISPVPPALSLPRHLGVEMLAWGRRAAVRRAALIVTPSDQVAWEVSQLYGRRALSLPGAYPARIFDHRPGLDARAALGLPEGLVVLIIARLIPKKRVDLCLRAFAEVAASHPDATLIVGGTGPEESKLRAIAVELGLEGRIHFVGYVPDDCLWDYQALTDVFVQLDRADFDIVTHEALALGTKAVVSTEHEIDPASPLAGRVFAAPPEVGAVAGAIEAALAAPKGPLSPAERAYLARYTWENYFAAILDRLQPPAGLRVRRGSRARDRPS